VFNASQNNCSIAGCSSEFSVSNHTTFPVFVLWPWEHDLFCCCALCYLITSQSAAGAHYNTKNSYGCHAQIIKCPYCMWTCSNFWKIYGWKIVKQRNGGLKKKRASFKMAWKVLFVDRCGRITS
jgi:hypothetical protein